MFQLCQTQGLYFTLVTKFKPAIYDDGKMQKEEGDVPKAVLNPAEEDCTIWARYGSATMDQGYDLLNLVIRCYLAHSNVFLVVPFDLSF